MRSVVVAFLALALSMGLDRSVHAAEPIHAAMFKRLSALSALGNADVSYHLGMFLNNGLGTNRDPEAAFEKFRQAAENGHALGAYKVGCYHAGQFPGVVPLDEKQAFRYKSIAAQAGYDLAQQELGTHLAKQGHLEEALVWWERAARQGDLPATALLARHFSGDRSPDKVQGLTWTLILRERAPRPNPVLQDAMAKLQATLSDREIQEAEHRRSAWSVTPSALTLEARAGIQRVWPLLADLEKP